MTPDDVDFLAKRIINSFRGGPPLQDWREELARLDAGRAGTAYERLRRHSDAPSIKRFLDEYNALDTDRPSELPRCVLCDGTGWVQAPDLVLPDERRYTQLEPCRCPRGQQAEQTAVWRRRKESAA